MSKIIDLNDTYAIWAENPAIVAAWVFGSAQHGKVRQAGDIDIAILTNRPLTWIEKLDLLGALQDKLQFENVELIVLNEANSILRFEAVCGRLLFSRDEGQRAAFVSLTAREYEDEMAQWQHALHMRGNA